MPDIEELKRSASARHSSSQYALGCIFRDGNGVPQDYSEAMKWYKLASNQGHKKAQYEMAVLFENGKGIPKDYRYAKGSAKKYYYRSAKKGYALAQYSVGKMYEFNTLGPKYLDKAHKWYKLAADQGNADATEALRRVESKISSRNSEIERITCLAKGGDTKAQFDLGQIFRRGQDLPEDHDEAVKWYELSAEQGYVDAQYMLGYPFFEDNYGLNDGEIDGEAKWLRLLAEQGCAGAQRDLGEMYEIGYGVPRDYKEAAKWYKKAAEQGDTEAKKALLELEKELKKL